MNKIKRFIFLLTAASVLLTGCSKGDKKEEAAAGLLNSSQPPILEAQTEDSGGGQTVPSSLYAPINHDEVRGVWISFIELSGILTKKTEKQFRKSYAEMMDNCTELGINTVYVHLRPFGDALYESDCYPWSKYVTGKVGQSPDFDPLKVMLEESHERGISFHGWINPLRIQHEADIAKVSEDFPIGKWYKDEAKRGKYVVLHGENWYLNPAYGEVTALIGEGAAEIARKYDVDGIHIDDYFYPTVDASFDADAFGESDFSDVGTFRTFNCNNMVRALYTSVKQGNPNALFGISPSGNIRHNTEELYADVEAWCKNIGYTDYIAPQVYYGFEHAEQPYAECVSDWQKMLDNSPVKLLVGLAVYKIGSRDAWAGDGEEEWLTENEILLRQIEQARGLLNYSGVIFFSYNWLFSAEHVTAEIQEEIDAFREVFSDTAPQDGTETNDE